jgi:diketogulonate reductase-like aldo/keto reductase
MTTIKTREGFEIPLLGLGTSGIPAGKEGVEAVKTAIKIGYAHIDTAEIYGNNATEKVIGEAIVDVPREKLFITTKVSSRHLSYNEVHEAMKGSLNRLRTDYVDLYLIHWPNPNVPLKETMKAMVELAESGQTRLLGVSNFNVGQVKEAEKYADGHGVVANQVHYSLRHQDPREVLLPYCHQRNIILTAYTPLEKGTLAIPGYTVLDELAEKYNKTQAQVSLNWLISQKNVVAIPKSDRKEHQKDNLGALGWSLSDEDARRLGNSF